MAANHSVFPLLWLLVFASIPAQAEVLGLDAYIGQVESANHGMQASHLAAAGLRQKNAEAGAAYIPVFTADMTVSDDRSGGSVESAIQANAIQSAVWNIGLSKRFPTGTRIHAGYANTAMPLDLASPYPINAQTWSSHFTAHDIKPYLRLEQSLLRDGFGQTTAAGLRRIEYAIQSAEYLEAANRQRIACNARAAYARLALCREIVRFRREGLARSAEILRWSESKVRLDLADRGDRLQALARHRQSELDLQLALDEETDARREFNHMRDWDAGAVAGTLQGLQEILTDSGEELRRSGDRADVLSARAGLAGAESAAAEAQGRLGPELTAFGSVSWHGLDTEYPAAFRQVANREKPTYAAGAVLVLPLDPWTAKAVCAGYAQERRAAEARVRQAERDAAKDWQALSDQWAQAKARLAAARDVREIQERRVEHLRREFKRGRTTTFQLLSAENDRDAATLNVHRAVFEALLIRFQADLHNTPAVARGNHDTRREAKP